MSDLTPGSASDEQSTPTQGNQPVRKERPSAWLIIAIIAILVLTLLSTSQATEWMKRLEYEGAPAPTVALPALLNPRTGTLAGESVDLSRFSKDEKVMLLDFWATWCGPCRKQLPIVASLASDPALRDRLQVVTINVDDEAPDREANVSAYMKMKRYELLTLLDDGSAQKAYKIKSIPTLVIVDCLGNVHSMSYGVQSRETLVTWIDEASTAGL